MLSLGSAECHTGDRGLKRKGYGPQALILQALPRNDPLFESILSVSKSIPLNSTSLLCRKFTPSVYSNCRRSIWMFESFRVVGANLPDEPAREDEPLSGICCLPLHLKAHSSSDNQNSPDHSLGVSRIAISFARLPRVISTDQTKIAPRRRIQSD